MTSVMRGLLDIKNRFDSVSEVESRLSEENRVMRNQLQQLQLEAELSSRVAENEDTKDCPICFGTYKMSEGVVCSGNAKHFMCNDCFGYRVKSFALEKDEFGLEPIWMEIDSPSIIDDLAIAKRIATELMSAVNGSI